MKKGNVVAVVIAVIVLLGLLGSCSSFDSDYERAGKEFGTWVNSDPNSWTDTQKDYFNDFMEWSSEN